jgi:hypothetical protein
MYKTANELRREFRQLGVSHFRKVFRGKTCAECLFLESGTCEKHGVYFGDTGDVASGVSCRDYEAA